MTNWDACERLAARIGEQAGDLSSEHERWRIYRLSAEIPEAWDGLLAAIVSERQPEVAAAAAVRLLERVPPDMRNVVVELLAGRHGHDFAALRSRELGTLESLRAGGQDVGYVRENLDSWSSWLELRVAGEVTDERILAELTSSGRTKRVRETAHRSRDQGILEALRDGRRDASYAHENLGSWSHWLQLSAAREVTDEGILAELAGSGQTRRVRSIASERLKYLPAQRMPRSGPPPSTTRRWPVT